MCDSETASTAVADASAAGTASPPAADALKSECNAVATPAPSSSPPSGPDASVASPDGHNPSASAADTLKHGSAAVVTHAADALESGSDAVLTPAPSSPAPQQSVSPEPPACSVSSPEDSSHDTLKQGVAPHLAPSSCTTLRESDSAVSGGDVAAEQAPAHSLDGSQAQVLTTSPTAAALFQSVSSRGDAEQPVSAASSSSCCNGNDHPCSREEEEQPEEQDPSELPQAEEDEHMLEHSAPLLLPLPLPLAAGCAQEDAQQAEEFAPDTRTEASMHCSRDATCNAADVPEPAKKPGLLAKTLFCTVFSPVLVPVLAVGGCLQLCEALSVQRTLWKYTMAGSEMGCNSGTAA